MYRLLATVILLSATAAPGQALIPSARLAQPPARAAVRQRTFQGAWLGEMQGLESPIRVLLKIWGSEAEATSAATAVRATAVGTLLKLELSEPDATFEGRLHPDGGEIIGRWRQGDDEQWFVFRRLASDQA